MPFTALHRRTILASVADSYLEVIDTNIQREFPYMPWMVIESPERIPHHRELHPVFFGCFDWHSCVEMWWAAVRILGTCPGSDGKTAIRTTMDSLLTEPAVAIEAAFFSEPRHRSFERPYGWAWLLTLQHELNTWSDPDAERWAQTLQPLTETIIRGFVAWLPKLTYPQRTGMHANTAFALTRSIDLAAARAERGDTGLLDAIREAALRCFADDRDYPAHYEPSGADFLSGALAEAELMARILDHDRYDVWLSAFLPGLAQANPAQLFTPATVSDHSDGQIAHLTGLNLSRAAACVAIVNALSVDDARIDPLLDAADRHATAALGAVVGSGYMEEHWLAAYATLLLTA